jgi:two-component system, response regulator
MALGRCWVQQKRLEVLLIEDNIDDAELIGQTLEGYQPSIVVIAVQDGAEALDCLFGTGQYAEKGLCTPQLILLDLSLPKVGGLQVLRVIRSYVRTSVIPVVILSATSEERKVVESYQLGVNSYLVKPHDIEQFRELIKQVAAYWLRVHIPPTSENAMSTQDKNGPSLQDEDLTRLGP